MRVISSVLVLLLAACQPAAEPGPTAAPDGAAEEQVVAVRFDGREITVVELDDWVKDKLFERASQDSDPSILHTLRARAAEQLAAEHVVDAEAVRQGKTRDALLTDEAASRASVSDADVQAYYEANPEQMGGLDLSEVTPAIRAKLEGEGRQGAAQAYIEELRAAAGYELLLEPPRVEVAGDGPSVGPADAPVTIVEFSDYQCPYCKSAEPVVQQVLAKYGDRVRFVYRHFPIERIHPRARPAAEAAACADEQGRFWEYHRVVFEKAPALEDADLRGHAEALGLDVTVFDACVAERRPQAAIDADLAAGRAAGVAGTPSFYINGVPVTGAASVDDFARVVDAELAAQGG